MMAKSLVAFSLLMMLFSLEPSRALAWKEICPDGNSANCKISEGNCDGHCPNAPLSPTCTDQGSLVLKLDKDYILHQGNKAWLITDKRKIALLSDKAAKFISMIQTKYAKSDKKDRKLQERISAEFATFWKTDDGIIGAERVALISKETRLKVRESDKK